MHDIKDPSQVTVADPVALALTAQLQQAIKQEIADQGPIAFDRFMEMALYQPGLGYYAAGSAKIGSAGDFVTAPEVSFIFSHCVARQCMQVLTSTGGSILEFGAGSGIMAANILDYLDKHNALPEHYFILDLSPDLKQRQQQTLLQNVPDLLSRVVWLDEMPQKFCGVVLANEVLDAMPVSLFKKHNDEILEQHVAVNAEQLELCWLAANKNLQTAVRQIEQDNGAFADGYVSEVNMRLAGWLAALSAAMQTGMVLLIDYGYTCKEYYHAERHMGTLICHYQHRAHDDPLKLVGLQDITANVDFTAVANSAQAAGFDIAGFTPQANFLMATGIEELLAPYLASQPDEFMQLSQAVKVLMLPSQMGERFKVMGLSKGLHEQALGFSMRDLSDRL